MEGGDGSAVALEQSRRDVISMRRVNAWAILDEVIGLTNITLSRDYKFHG
jgi:hypothetical protein